MLENSLSQQEAERDSIRTQTRIVAEETKVRASLSTVKVKAEEAEWARKALEKELSEIPLKVDDAKVKAHQAATTKLQSLKTAIAKEERRAQELKDVSAEIQRQLRTAETALSELRAKHPTLLEPELWEALKPAIDDAAIAELAKLERQTRERTADLRANGLAPAEGGVAMGLSALSTEAERLMKELGLDEAKIRRKSDLMKRIGTARLEEEKAKNLVTNAEGAPARLKEAQDGRLARYEALFDAVTAEEDALQQLYAPLRQQVTEDPRLSKLNVVVHRVVDIAMWASRGEALLDLRKPPFNGRGVLLEAARKILLGSWQRGTPPEAREAMQRFIKEYGLLAAQALAQGVTPLDFGEWLFSTDHISVRYGIHYEDVEIAHLSPGTRGVVLLTLYLALDKWDSRPLIIDQPEENLDPRSVYSDLVPFFRDAAKRRQIVMVTHNANLVVNTDSDQVIVAEAQRTSPMALPRVRYTAGGLEDAEIRRHVCRLLEGGEEAFRKRGQRYGVPE